MTAENQAQPPAADGDAASRRESGVKAAADELAATRTTEDQAIEARRLKEDRELADRRTAEDRVLESAGHRLFLAAAAMTAAVNGGDLDQVRGANAELQAAIDAHLAAGGQNRETAP